MNLHEELMLSLKTVHENMVGVMKSVNDELPQGHLFLLFMIYKKGSIKTNEISHHFGITPGAATAIADKLEQKGLIERVRDQQDRRIVVITLSDQGVEFVHNKKKEYTETFKKILRDFSDQQLITTIESINLISTAIKDYQEKNE